MNEFHDVKILLRKERASPALVSIVVATLNSEKTLSCLFQSAHFVIDTDIEIIISDGGSTDGTIDICNENSQIIDCLLSGRDTGVYQAWNRALKHCHGRFIQFVGSDDVILFDYLKTLKLAINARGIGRIDFFSFPIQRMTACGNLSKRNYRPLITKFLMNNHLSLPHPGLIISSDFFLDRNPFDEKYKIAGDYKFIVAMLQRRKRSRIRGKILTSKSNCILEMGNSGLTGGYKNSRITLSECRRARRENDLPKLTTAECATKALLYIRRMLFSLRRRPIACN